MLPVGQQSQAFLFSDLVGREHPSPLVAAVAPLLARLRPAVCTHDGPVREGSHSESPPGCPSFPHPAAPLRKATLGISQTRTRENRVPEPARMVDSAAAGRALRSLSMLGPRAPLEP